MFNAPCLSGFGRFGPCFLSHQEEGELISLSQRDSNAAGELSVINIAVFNMFGKKLWVTRYVCEYTAQHINLAKFSTHDAASGIQTKL